jgi:hypothetical protein
MITVKAPCPVCHQPVKVDRYHGTFLVGCSGRGQHCVSMFGYATPEEAAAAWDKLFSVSEGVPFQ